MTMGIKSRTNTASGALRPKSRKRPRDISNALGPTVSDEHADPRASPTAYEEKPGEFEWEDTPNGFRRKKT